MGLQNSHEPLVPFTASITVEQYISFINQLPQLSSFTPDISQLKGRVEMTEATTLAASLFKDLIKIININLADKGSGIAVVDIPESQEIDPTENAFWGVALALALTKNIFEPAHDRINDTPYTVYAASYRNSEKLAKIGLPPIAPEEKLGFHTDGLLTGPHVALPHHIMLYNIAIEYKKPGNFYWIPFSLWKEKEKYIKLIGLGDRYKISVTPSVYETSINSLKTVSPQHVYAPIFVDTAAPDHPMYINGTVIERCNKREFDINIINEMKNSISANPQRFVVSQKTRRIIFAKNVAGAHARDVFQLPNAQAAYTRVFMRSVDKKCVELE